MFIRPGDGPGYVLLLDVNAAMTMSGVERTSEGILSVIDVLERG